jgi:AcrR family transcriptional regulator
MDRRVERTQAALLAAFRDLLLEGRFESAGIAEIAKRALVSRSTLYEHFAGKDALLARSISRPFSTLADVVEANHDDARLVALLNHFWGNRALARVIFQGPVRRKAVAVLVGLLEQRLKGRGLARRGALMLPMRLAAVQIAEALLAPITAWLVGESRCTPEVLAMALRRVAVATLGALTAGDATWPVACQIRAEMRG